MKYLEAKFYITDTKRQSISDETLLQAIKDVLCELAGNAGFESFDDSQAVVVGYVQEQNFSKDMLEEYLNNFPINDVLITYEINNAEDKNWNAAWEELGFEPIYIENRCVIHDMGHNSESHTNENILDITIDTEQAFGTGNHETTYMIISELFDTEMENKSFLDCGCGTGILSIVASKLGARQIMAYDIDEWSVRNTEHNCSLNGINNISVLLGDSGVLTDIENKFDIVTANINRNILLADMRMFKEKMSDHAILILSGFYTNDAEILIEKAEELNLKLIKESSRNDWCMLKFQNCAN